MHKVDIDIFVKNPVDKIYFLCEGYQIKKNLKNIIYYHVPKSGGTTISNLFLSLFEKPYRISGHLVKTDHFISCYENFEKNKDKIKLNNYNFICGHIQFLDFFKDRFSITTIRDPIERSISNYNMLVERRLINVEKDIEECFITGLIPNNPITQMFSSNNSNNLKINTQNKEKAILNLKTLDLIVDFNEIDKLINFIISAYDLPNILYQHLQKNKKNYFIKNEKNLQTIKNYNQHDIEIFDLLNKQNLFFNFPQMIKKRDNNNYFIYSLDFKINGHNNLITQRSNYNAFIDFLEEKNYLIKKVI